MGKDHNTPNERPSKVSAISASKKDIDFLCLSLYQLAQLVYVKATGAPVEPLIARVNECKKKVTERDLRHIARELEALLLKDVAHNCGAASCSNCDQRYDCAEMTALVNSDTIECCVHYKGAAANCPNYSPDRDVFDTMAEKTPELLAVISQYGAPVNVAETAKKALEIAGEWILELEHAGKSLPPRL